MDWAELISQINWASVVGNIISGTGILILSWLGYYFRRAIFQAMLYLWARARAAAITAGQWLRLVTHCRAIAIENAQLKAAVSDRDAQIAELRQKLQLHKDTREQTTGKHILQFLHYAALLDVNNPADAELQAFIESWHKFYLDFIVNTCRDRGLFADDVGVTPAGFALLIKSGVIPTPQ